MSLFLLKKSPVSHEKSQALISVSLEGPDATRLKYDMFWTI